MAGSVGLQVVVSKIVKTWKPLPTMVTGMLFGAVGFALLAISQNPWVFIAGIAIFSIGEMTAHPKYYSFVGLVAPADRKAVYMGYAFLYTLLYTGWLFLVLAGARWWVGRIA